MARNFGNLSAALDLVNRLEFDCVSKVRSIIGSAPELEEGGALYIEQMAKAIARLRVQVYNEIGDIDGDHAND